MRAFDEMSGFGTVVGTYTYDGVIYYEVVWDRDPHFTDDVSQAEVEIIG